MEEITTYEVNAPHVVEESIDGEVIVINLDSGCYYSLTGPSVFHWENLKGSTLESLKEKSAAVFSDTPPDHGQIIGNFVEHLEQEQLVRKGNSKPPSPGLDDAAFEGQAFEVPALEKFTDMQDLLLLDPIHDVSDEGWPVMPKGQDEIQHKE